MFHYIPYSFLLLTVILWGSSFPFIKFLLDSMNPLELALSRFFIPAICAFFYLMFFKIKIDKFDYLRFVISSMTGILGFTIFINLGLQTISAGAGSFVVNLNPLFTSLIGFYILKQKISNYFWKGIFVCLVGVFIISIETSQNFTFNIGTLYLLLAAILIAVYFHATKPLVNKYGTLTTFCLTIFLGTIPMLICIKSTYVIILHSSFFINLSIFWISIMSTLIPYYTWTYSVGYFGANKASFFLFLIPVIAIIIDLIIFKNYPNFYTIVGGSLILISIFIVMIKCYRENI